MAVFKPAAYFLFFSLLTKVSFSQQTSALLWYGFVSHLLFQFTPSSWWGELVIEWGLSCQPGSAQRQKIGQIFVETKKLISERPLSTLDALCFIFTEWKEAETGRTFHVIHKINADKTGPAGILFMDLIPGPDLGENRRPANLLLR